MSKKALRGFANLGVIPVEEDTTTSYKVTAAVEKLIGAQTCAPTDNKEDFTIPADDGIYDSGAEWTSTTLVITVVEAVLKQLALMSGAEFDDDTDLMEEGVLDAPAELALTFSALRRDGGYRLYRYYMVKLNSYSVTHNTKGQDSGDAQSYELTFEATPRKVDGNIRGTLDIAKGESMDWLDEIPDVPTP